jgi:cytidine deaminase
VTAGRDALVISPCGGCRQRIREFAVDGQVLVHFPWQGAELRMATVDELLPFAFELPGMRTR